MSGPDREPLSRPFPDPEHSIAPRKPRTLGGMVYLGVLTMTLAGVVTVVLDHWRTGLVSIGGAVLCGAVARLLISEENAGMLGVRGKLLDVTTMVIVGSTLLALASFIRDRP